jgi:hypothetical protein
MKSIKSSNLESASYDVISKTLIVNFRNGTSYKYFNISSGLNNQFEETFSGENGKSAGKFFNQHIKNFECQKLDN